MARILVIDDDEALGAVLQRTLEHAGHVVRTAANGRAAAAMLRREVPDVVVTDLLMPEQDGMEVIMMMRTQHPEIPVIAMSGGSEHAPLYLKIARKLGARRVLAKPFASDELFAT